MAADRRDPCILLVEDDLSLASMVADWLRARHYAVWHVERAADAELAIDQARPDVIVLDLMLPDGNGLTLCVSLKQRADAPLIICSATRRKDDAVIALQLGADDFLRKPFSMDELQARIDLALRRGRLASRHDLAQPSGVRRIGELTVDQARCEATALGQPLQLTPTEFRLLSALASRAPEVVQRHQLAEQIWGCVDAAVIRSLDVHMRRLRAKLTATRTGARLLTRRGFGYQLADAADTGRAAAAGSP
jgi:DNA-binding response OmpR family regulator